MTTFFGKYRGTVTGDLDPQQRGRVQVAVPAVLGDGRSAWAEVCVPYAGDKVGLWAVPPAGANVWVEFEGGDPERPILAGCFWGDRQAPADQPDPMVKIWRTEAVTLTLSDVPGKGGLTVEVGSPAVTAPMTLVMGPDGIALSIGSSKIELTQTSVSVNGGALEVV